MNDIKGHSIAWEDLIRKFTKGKPKDVNGLGNLGSERYREYLLKKIFAVFDFTFPKWWDYDYTIEKIFIDGYIGITDTPAGVVGLRCGYTGINFYNHPTELVFSVPVLGNWNRTIGRDCVMLKLQYNFNGVNDIIDRYSYMLAACDASIDINLMNTRVVNVAYAENNRQSQTIKNAYDDMTSGKPLLVLHTTNTEMISNPKIPWAFNHVKEAYIADKIEELKRNIIADFLSEIGINNINIRKKERTNVAEVEANNGEIDNAVQHWFDNLSKGCKEARDMFNIDIDVKIRNNIGTYTESVNDIKEGE